MNYRLDEGDGEAFYNVGVMDSGQVTGLSDEEIFETLLILFYMTTTLKQVKIEVHKVRKGLIGNSVMLRVTRKSVTNFDVFNIQEECKDS
jgi:elongation factor 1-alpha